jgi:peptidoglycan/xylan/chitin deacetylase (PgdA/CDA1 family)
VRAISLLYHDVVLPGQFSSSGFPGGDADIYKLTLPDFERHLHAIRSAIPKPPIIVSELGDIDIPYTRPLLTFDDGGVSAHEHIARLLETVGWRGHFFVTTNWIGKEGFLNVVQIRDLAARGHFIGSHSCSHPARMSHCSRQQLRREWSQSIAVLSDILGAKVDIASVPGGYYGRNVAEEAADAGIKTLFTSEPQTQANVVNACWVLGRYTIKSSVTPGTAAAMASGHMLPRFQQFAYWNAKKLLKTAGGSSWLRMRKRILAGAPSSAVKVDQNALHEPIGAAPAVPRSEGHNKKLSVGSTPR